MLLRDLIMQLVEPFKLRKVETRVRLAIMILVCLLSAAFLYEEHDIDGVNRKALIYLSICVLFFYIYAIVCLCIAFYLIKNLGLGKETKKKILWR